MPISKYIATVCFFIRGKQVLLVEIEYPDGRKLWNGIGGKVDDNETPLDAVVREIGEETELRVLKTDIQEADVITEGDFELHVFVTTRWEGATTAIDPTLKRFQWFDFTAVPYEIMHRGNDNWLPAVLRGFGK